MKIQSSRHLIPCIVLFLAAQTIYAQKPAYDVFATGSKRILLFDPDFNVKWEYPAGNITEVHRLKNGNILFADGRVMEITPDKQIVFQYAPPEKKEGSYGCQRLPNGNTLIGENYTGKIKELAPEGSVVFELQTQFKTDDQHQYDGYRSTGTAGTKTSAAESDKKITGRLTYRTRSNITLWF